MCSQTICKYRIDCYPSRVKTVPLGGTKAAGRVALVDDKNYELVMRYRWYAWEQQRPGHTNGPYAQTNIMVNGRKTTTQMHKLLAPQWSKIDHADGNGLNNQENNLRDGSGARNNRNQRGKRTSVSGYKGVSIHQSHGRRPRWRARIRHNGAQSLIGLFDSPEAAARAYDAKAIELFGEYAWLNFPGEAGRG